MDQVSRARDWNELKEWWLAAAEKEIKAASKKAEEYSSIDLELMGQALPGGLEHAIGFYALGKAARIAGALAEGQPVKEDSWRDLRTYAGMALRAREVGGWPW